MSKHLLPNWLKNYDKLSLNQDILSGIIVGILVIPQSLGYAMLAGLPPVYGLYSAIVPVLIYAWIGASNVNAIGPVAITAIMTAQALHPFSHLPSEQYAILASFLAFITGLMFWLASLFRLGWITQFISRGVTAGFISGAAILIFFSQLKFITGITISGNSLIDNIISCWQNFHQLHIPTFILGLTTLIILIINRYYLKHWLNPLFHKKTIGIINKILPLFIVIISIILSQILSFSEYGIKILHTIPQGLPKFTIPYNTQLSIYILSLLPSAGLMALVSFISSNSVASQFARQRQENFNSNRELKGLGIANIIGAFFQSFTAVGGFSRTAINADSGAKTPLASIISMIVIMIVLLGLSSLLAPLPYAILGATIMSAIIGLVDIETFKQALKSDHLDALAFSGTFLSVLVFGLNTGLVLGLLVSFAGLIWQSSHPHIAIVGQIGDTGHFRNVQRHQVTMHDELLIIRIDESLFYGNAQSVQTFIEKAIASYPLTKNLVLMLSAVNHIDLTAQDMLVNLNNSLQKQNIYLHFSEIKGPVMDIIANTPVIQQLSGNVFLSTQQAVKTLAI